jgi:hypothetical protein
MNFANWHRPLNFILAPSEVLVVDYEFNLELQENPTNDAYTNRTGIGNTYFGATQIISGEPTDNRLLKQDIIFWLGNNGLLAWNTAPATTSLGTLITYDLAPTTNITGFRLTFTNEDAVNSARMMGSFDLHIQDTPDGGLVVAP